MLAPVARVWVGTSGWRYPPWRGAFYPAGLAQRRELEYLSRQVSSIEINGSFYSLQRPESYRAWAAETPDDFVFAVKGGRFITHLKQLRDVETPLANFFASGVLALGAEARPAAVAAAAADALRRRPAGRVPGPAAAHRPGRPRGWRPGTTSGWTGGRSPRPTPTGRCGTRWRCGTRASATRRSSRCCGRTTSRWWSPTRPAPGRTSRSVTAGFGYVRLHGADELYTSGYTAGRAGPWAATVRAWLADGRDVFVYFDNDAKVHAPRDAIALLARLTAT